MGRRELNCRLETLVYKGFVDFDFIDTPQMYSRKILDFVEPPETIFRYLALKYHSLC